jgi:hypothetical protein
MPPNSASLHRPAAPRSGGDATEAASTAPWLEVVAEKIKTMRFGVVQIVVHDSKVVQIERTERTRFDVPNGASSR